MLNENLIDRIKRLQSHKVALETELKLIADELAKCEELLKAEGERARSIETLCAADVAKLGVMVGGEPLVMQNK